MLKLVLRGISASKGRLALTMLSIIFGVAFVSGSFVLADSLRSVFDKVSEDIFAGIDAQVRAADGAVDQTGNPLRFDEEIADQLASVEGVKGFDAGLSGFEVIYTLDSEGEIVRPQGPPVLVFSVSSDSETGAFELVEGSLPIGQQTAIDSAQADQGGFTVGDQIEVTTPNGIEEFELSGLIRFGSPGAMFVTFDLPTAQRLLDAEGQIDGIAISAEDGVDAEELVRRLQAVAPPEVEAITVDQAVDETQEQFGSFISIFGNILLAFAMVSLFVSIFIIYNTFAILVSQRTKQMGLLRAIGAKGNQVLGMVMAEAFVVGIVASILGLFGGIGVAALLKQLFSQAGGEFPDGPLEIKLRTVVFVMFVGLFVTIVSAILPAYRASRISPLEALRDGGEQNRSMTFRLIAGSVVLVPGVILLGLGLAGTTGSTTGVLSLLGGGSVLTFVGVAMLSALFAGKVTSLLGFPVEMARGTVGRISRDNASRNPQRTAATATALMIGLALITGVTVLASSIKATFNDLLGDALAADIFIFEPQGFLFTEAIADQMAELSETDAVASFRDMNADVSVAGVSSRQAVTAFDSERGGEIIKLEALEGTSQVGDGIAVKDTVASDLNVQLGDTIEIVFEAEETVSFEVVGIIDGATSVNGDWIVDREIANQYLAQPSVSFVGVTFADGVSAEGGRAAVDDVAAAFPQLSVQDNSEFQEQIEGQVNQILVVINGLLGLCLLIAFFGIINTMALSVLERTREIGLLRAVGMTRSQLRSSIRWEAVIVSLFGALLGVIMGVVLAYAGISALPEGFITKTAIPFLSIVLYLVLGAVLGVVAAYFPARRAAKLDVLEAIATN